MMFHLRYFAPFYLSLFLFGCNSSNKFTSTDFTDGTYIGEVDDQGRKHGKGMYKWLDGSSYEGDFDEDLRHGVGHFKWSNGESYKGDYLADRRTGEGIYLWRDGSKYEGSFLNGKRHGIGTFTSSNGSIYVGEWFDDLMHGKGKLTRHDGTVLSGSWQNGKFLDNSPPLPLTSEKPDLEEIPTPKNKEDEPNARTSYPDTEKEDKKILEKEQKLSNFKPTQSYKSEDNSSVPEIISTGSPNSNTNLPINNDTSNLQEKQPSDENTETNKIEEITTPGNEISESNVWTGTVREAEIAFQTKLIEGIDTVFDRKTDRRFSGKMEIVDSSGVKKGELELVNGRMNGEELFYENGELVEKYLWENGKFVRSIPVN